MFFAILMDGVLVVVLIVVCKTKEKKNGVREVGIMMSMVMG